MFLNNINPQFIKSLNNLYASKYLVKGEWAPLQLRLERAMKTDYGISKDLSKVVSTSFKQKATEIKPIIDTLTENNRSNSETDLEFTLKEDLMCIVCNRIDVRANNCLLECSDCHMLYHQQCHEPIVTNQNSFDAWICQNCKKASKQLKLAVTTEISTIVHSSSTTSSSSSDFHLSQKIQDDLKSDIFLKTNSSLSNSSSSTLKPATSLSISRKIVNFNMDIISAEKRIEIMKKKAAKLHQKNPRRGSHVSPVVERHHTRHHARIQQWRNRPSNSRR